MNAAFEADVVLIINLRGTTVLTNEFAPSLRAIFITNFSCLWYCFGDHYHRTTNISIPINIIMHMEDTWN